MNASSGLVKKKKKRKKAEFINACYMMCCITKHESQSVSSIQMQAMYNNTTIQYKQTISKKAKLKILITGSSHAAITALDPDDTHRTQKSESFDIIVL